MLLMVTGAIFAQQSSTDSSKLTLSGYADVYYGYDFSRPANDTRPSFVYSYNKTNEIAVNLAFLKAAYTSTLFRSDIAFMAGTYASANLAAEPDILQHILEANAGIKLAKKANLWLDAGVFSSHIGFESAIGRDCWTLTRSIMADNSPYFESGAKIGYTTDDGKLFVSGLALNGWQHIKPNDNTSLSGGLQVTYAPNDKLTLNYSNFYGNDKPDTARRQRFYNDFYAIYQLTPKFGITAGLDFASEQKYKGSSTYNYLYSTVIIARYKPIDAFAIAARIEYYQDPNGILIKTNTPDGFKTTGYSINADYKLFKNTLLRVEYKYLNSKDEIFTESNSRVNYNSAITTSFAAWF